MRKARRPVAVTRAAVLPLRTGRPGCSYIALRRSHLVRCMATHRVTAHPANMMEGDESPPPPGIHAISAAAAPLIPVSRALFYRVPPGIDISVGVYF